jgi:GTPase SAR1 family protein
MPFNLTHTYILTRCTCSAAYGEKVIAINDEVVKLACWDTAGQERYRYVTFMLLAILRVAICPTYTRVVSCQMLDSVLHPRRECLLARLLHHRRRKFQRSNILVR